jgi:hypothetical protein
MKLKVVTVDLELSVRGKQVLGATGLIAIAAVASAAVPKQFVSGEVLTANDLNTNFAALDTRVAAVEGKVANELDVLPGHACKKVTLNNPGNGDLGAQLKPLLATNRCTEVTLTKNTAWTWNTPIDIAPFQSLRVAGEGYTNGAGNITVTINMTQNGTININATDKRLPGRVYVGDNAALYIDGVHIIESSKDARPLSDGACGGGALFDAGGSFSRITAEQIIVDTTEDFIGVGSRATATIQLGHTFVNQGTAAPRAILATKSYTGWCFAGGDAVVHRSHTTLGSNVNWDTNTKLRYSN